MNESKDTISRIATLELQSPPVPRQSAGEEHVLQLVREHEFRAALDVLGISKPDLDRTYNVRIFFIELESLSFLLSHPHKVTKISLNLIS